MLKERDGQKKHKKYKAKGDPRNVKEVDASDRGQVRSTGTGIGIPKIDPPDEWGIFPTGLFSLSLSQGGDVVSDGDADLSYLCLHPALQN